MLNFRRLHQAFLVELKQLTGLWDQHLNKICVFCRREKTGGVRSCITFKQGHGRKIQLFISLLYLSDRSKTQPSLTAALNHPAFFTGIIIPVIADPLFCTASKGFTFCNKNPRNSLEQNELGFTSHPARHTYLHFHKATNKLDKAISESQNQLGWRRSPRSCPTYGRSKREGETGTFM